MAGGRRRSATGSLLGIALRDAACADGANVPGSYFGTRDGDVYATTDDGDRRHQVTAHLPDVLSVRAVEV